MRSERQQRLPRASPGRSQQGNPGHKQAASRAAAVEHYCVLMRPVGAVTAPGELETSRDEGTFLTSIYRAEQTPGITLKFELQPFILSASLEFQAFKTFESSWPLLYHTPFLHNKKSSWLYHQSLSRIQSPLPSSPLWSLSKPLSSPA